MQRFTMILIALCVPLGLQTACSSDEPTNRRGSGAQHGNNGKQPSPNTPNDPNDAGEPPPEEDPGEEPGEGEEPGQMDAGGGTTDTGGGTADTGGSTDTGGGTADTGSGGTPDTGAAPPPPPAPKTVSVSVGNYFFAPKTVTVNVGDTVQWSFGAAGHTVTSGGSCTPNGQFDSGLRSMGTTYSQTFTSPGTYNYHCIPHCASDDMTGTVVVMP